jgi:hypothetical protein
MPTYPVDPIFSAGVLPFLDFFFLLFSRGGGSNLIRIHVKSEAAAVARYNNAQR